MLQQDAEGHLSTYRPYQVAVQGEEVSPTGELPHAGEKKVADARRVRRWES
jgi:hypothetical protein